MNRVYLIRTESGMASVDLDFNVGFRMIDPILAASCETAEVPSLD